MRTSVFFIHITVQRWRVKFFRNDGEFLQGKYERMGVVSNNEDLSKQARELCERKRF
jgi:hypothetical protein